MYTENTFALKSVLSNLHENVLVVMETFTLTLHNVCVNPCTEAGALNTNSSTDGYDPSITGELFEGDRFVRNWQFVKRNC